MIRLILEELALFVLPFVLYGLLLALQRKRVLDLEHWSRAATALVLSGFALAIGAIVLTAIFAERQTGPYVPPHIENGRPVQGGFR